MSKWVRAEIMIIRQCAGIGVVCVWLRNIEEVKSDS